MHSVRFLPMGRRELVPEGVTLLEAVRQAGLPIATACGGIGLCGRCGLHVIEGSDSLPAENEIERGAKLRNRVDPRSRLACQVRVVGPLVVRADYW